MNTDDLSNEFVVSLDSADRETSLLTFIRDLQSAKGYHSINLAWRDVILAGASRVAQLHRYNEKKKKKDATFRPYAPLKVSESKRGDVKRAAAIEGVATVKDPFPWRCTARAIRNGREARCQNSKRAGSATCGGAHVFL